MRTIRTGGLAALAVGILWASTSLAQQPQPAFPGGKAIEMTVMFGAGSAADVTARYLADGMAKRLNVPVPVVNRTGGGGAIGYSHVKKQRPTATRSSGTRTRSRPRTIPAPCRSTIARSTRWRV